MKMSRFFGNKMDISIRICGVLSVDWTEIKNGRLKTDPENRLDYCTSVRVVVL